VCPRHVTVPRAARSRHILGRPAQPRRSDQSPWFQHAPCGIGARDHPKRALSRGRHGKHWPAPPARRLPIESSQATRLAALSVATSSIPAEVAPAISPDRERFRDARLYRDARGPDYIDKRWPRHRHPVRRIYHGRHLKPASLLRSLNSGPQSALVFSTAVIVLRRIVRPRPLSPTADAVWPAVSRIGKELTVGQPSFHDPQLCPISGCLARRR